MVSIIRSVRLTEALREAVVSELTSGKFDAEMDAMFAKSRKLSSSCYDALYDAKARREIAALPDGWLSDLDYITVSFGVRNSAVKLHFNGYSRFLERRCFSDGNKPSDEMRRFLARDLRTWPQVEVQKSSALATQYAEVVAENARIQKDRERLKDDITGVLCSVTTTGKLVSLWPEVEPLVRKLAPIESAPANLPAKTFASLNHRLGLQKSAA